MHFEWTFPRPTSVIFASVFAAWTVGVGAFGCAHASDSDLLAVRAKAPSQLVGDAPKMRDRTAPAAPRGVHEVVYTVGSGEERLELKAWFAVPEGRGPHPAVLFFHGDFTFGPDDFERMRPFLNCGFAVMTPMLRGENGNGGELELLWGEVVDGVAAARWLAARPEVDARHVYAVGHSIGGGLAALLSLVDDVPLVETASVGGIYVPETFVRWSKMEHQRDLVRFDVSRRSELELRVLGPNVGLMHRPHHAYVGRDDRWFLENVAAVATRAEEIDAPFTWEAVDGDHIGSVDPALAAWLERISEHEQRHQGRGGHCQQRDAVQDEFALLTHTDELEGLGGDDTR